MKVLIINPPCMDGVKFIREGRCEQRLSSFQYVMVPISLPSIGALLRDRGHEIKIVDAIAMDYSSDDLVKIIGDFTPGLLIVNFSTATFEGDSLFVDEIRKQFDGHITAIGAHVTSLSEESLKTTKLDSVVRSEPEFTCLGLANALSKGGGEELSKVKGLSYKTNGKIKANEKREFIENLDDLPFPSRDLMDNQRYTLPVINEPYTLIISSRGCPYDCIYCTAHTYYGKKLRLRSPEKIVEEMEEIVTRDKVRNITMWSDTFTLDKPFVMKISQGIMDKGLDIRWMCNGRVDKVDLEMLQAMKKSGCIGISYGVESGVQEILDNVKKGITLEEIRRAFKWTHEAGIETLAHVIFGLPGETKETIEETIRFVIGLDPDYAQFYCAIPFPGTVFHDMAKDKDWLEATSWSQYELNQSIISTPSLNSDELKEAKVRAYKKFYLRPAYFFKRLKKIHSIKDLWMTVKQGVSFISEWVLKS